nr:hypothetical protein [uncultured Flavobacterium sp.]
MINIERFNGKVELDNLLKQFVSIPTNTEIIERTGFSKGAVSGIMSGKVKPSKSFIEKFKKGFKINNSMIVEEKKPTPENTEWVILKSFNEYLIKENEFLKQLLLKK